jgi:hypothetical protein
VLGRPSPSPATRAARASPMRLWSTPRATLGGAANSGLRRPDQPGGLSFSGCVWQRGEGARRTIRHPRPPPILCGKSVKPIRGARDGGAPQ